jgi:hypothetical protein
MADIRPDRLRPVSQNRSERQSIVSRRPIVLEYTPFHCREVVTIRRNWLACNWWGELTRKLFFEKIVNTHPARMITSLGTRYTCIYIYRYTCAQN